MTTSTAKVRSGRFGRRIAVAMLFVVVVLFSICFLSLTGFSFLEAREFDALLRSSRIDRVEIVDLDRDHINVLTNEAAVRLLSRLAATNRVADPVRHKSMVTGHITLYTRGERIVSLGYFPREQVLSYGNYQFGFRDTNDIPKLFQPPP